MVGKILIVDDVATNRIVFKVKLGAACYQPLMASDGKSCLRLARETLPDLILLDLVLPDLSGIDVLRSLRADPLTADIPVLMFSASLDPQARLAALAAGADDFLTKPIDDTILMARLRNLLRSHEALAELGQRGATLKALGLAEAQSDFAPPGLIALVTERPELAMRLRRDLAGQLPDRVVALSREEALAEGSLGTAPDAFVIDADLGGEGGGMRLMSELRSRSATRHAAVVLIHAAPRSEDMAMAFDMGANDALPLGLPAGELAIRLRTHLRRKKAGDRLRHSVQDGLRLAVIDPLTGLYNRRYALPRLASIAERAEATGGSFAVMIVDLDRFKAVNDCWGHAAGDQVLIEVARRLGDNLRGSDLIARIGGEEFLVALPDASMAEARQTAERLCHAVHRQPIALPDGSELSVTISIGLAVAQGPTIPSPERVADVVDRADQALLVAKAEGRNKVILSRTAA
ncbi:diguanylate cyclase [Gemmobacter denitrificans]|uniref:diguanylate cyclase n=1 Tax=Gemmobacter denitrificans TaxID=3123040 RepID=A0ABU8BWD6_9RHOB